LFLRKLQGLISPVSPGSRVTFFAWSQRK